MESPTAASPSLPPNKSIFSEQDVSRVALRRHSVDKASRSGSISLKPTENRELANENNILHKENERKEHRIQALTKEIQSLRVTHSNDQVSEFPHVPNSGNPLSEGIKVNGEHH